MGRQDLRHHRGIAAALAEVGEVGVDRMVQYFVGAYCLARIVAGARHVERAELIGLKLLAAVVAQEEQLRSGSRGADREPSHRAQPRDVGRGPEDSEARVAEARAALARRT